MPVAYDDNSKLWITILTIYFLCHALIRISIGLPLTPDEIDILSKAARLQWHYDGTMPLYPWMQRGMLSLVGDPVIALAALKNLILLVLSLAVYGMVRASAAAHWAWSATICLVFVPQIAWSSQHGLTSPVLATSMAAMVILAVVATLKKPTILRYLWLGLMIGTGAISSLSFLWFLAALVLALLTHTDFRGMILSPRFLVTFVAACGLAGMPHYAAWLDGFGADLPVVALPMLTIEQGLARIHQGYAFLQTGIVFAAILLIGVCVTIYKGLGPRHATKPETAALRDLIARVVSVGFLIFLGAAIISGDNHATFADIQPVMFLTAPMAVLYLYPLMTHQAHRTVTVGAAALAMVMLVLSPAYYAFGLYADKPAPQFARMDAQ